MKKSIIATCLILASSVIQATPDLGLYKNKCHTGGTVVKTSYATFGGKKYLMVHVKLDKSGKVFESTVDVKGVKPEDFPKGSYFCAIDFTDD